MRTSPLLFSLVALVGCHGSSSAPASSSGPIEPSCSGSVPAFAKVGDGPFTSRVAPCGELLYALAGPSQSSTQPAPMVLRLANGTERPFDSNPASVVFADTGTHFTFFDRTTHETYVHEIATGKTGTMGKPIATVGFAYSATTPARAIAYGCGAQGLVAEDDTGKPVLFDGNVKTCIAAAAAGPIVMALHKDGALVAVDVARNTITPLAGADFVVPDPVVPGQSQPPVTRVDSLTVSADGTRALLLRRSVSTGTLEPPILYDTATGARMLEVPFDTPAGARGDVDQSRAGGHTFVFPYTSPVTIVDGDAVVRIDALSARPLAFGGALVTTAGDGGSRHVEIASGGRRIAVTDSSDLPIVSIGQRAFAVNALVPGDTQHTQLVVWSNGATRVVARTQGLAKVDWLGEDGTVVFDGQLDDPKVTDNQYGYFLSLPSGAIKRAPPRATNWSNMNDAIVSFFPSDGAGDTSKLVAIDRASGQDRVVFDLGAATYGQVSFGSKRAIAFQWQSELYWGAP